MEVLESTWNVWQPNTFLGPAILAVKKVKDPIQNTEAFSCSKRNMFLTKVSVFLVLKLDIEIQEKRPQFWADTFTHQCVFRQILAKIRFEPCDRKIIFRINV